MSSLRDIIPSRKGSRPCSEQIRKKFSLPHRLVTWWLTSGLLPPGDAREGSFSVFSRGGQPHALYVIVLWDPYLDVAHNLTNLKGLNLRLLRIWNKFKVIEGQIGSSFQVLCGAASLLNLLISLSADAVKGNHVVLLSWQRDMWLSWQGWLSSNCRQGSCLSS